MVGTLALEGGPEFLGVLRLTGCGRAHVTCVTRGKATDKET